MALKEHKCHCTTCQCRTNILGDEPWVCFLCQEGKHDRQNQFTRPKPLSSDGIIR